jgi:ribosome modulation factor
MEEHFQAGVEAARKGKSISACPYSTNRPYGKDWLRGYKSLEVAPNTTAVTTGNTAQPKHAYTINGTKKPAKVSLGGQTAAQLQELVGAVSKLANARTGKPRAQLEEISRYVKAAHNVLYSS